MSILIKGFDMPSKPTQIKIYPNGIIFCADKDGIYVPKAQAIQIPTSHGRIADVGEGEKKMCEECQFKGDCLNDPNVLCTDREIFSLAPTILEAEE